MASTEQTYPYERRPKLADGWLNWRNSRNRFIECAPIVLLTGAGASIPAGVPGLGLPPTITLASGVSFDPADLCPPPDASSPGDVLDLETLLIVADCLRALPPRVVHEGVGGTEQLDVHRAVLDFTVQTMLPRLAGGPSLSPRFVHAVINRVLVLDRRFEGQVLDGLADAITEQIFDACLGLRAHKLVELYGPLLERLVAALDATGAPLVVPIFTTNYDETFDYLADDMRQQLVARVGRDVVFVDGTEPSPGHPGWRTFDPKVYRRFQPSSGRQLVLVVFYLHGSLRWFGSAEPKPSFEVYAGGWSAARGRPEARALLQPNAQKVLWGKSHAAISDLFAPDRKDLFRPGAPYYPMRVGYLFLERCLRKTAALLAIGYSFRDSDCRDLLLEGWKRRGRPHLLLLDPKPEPIIGRLGPAPVATRVPRRFDPAAATEVAPALERALTGGDR